MHSNYRTYAVSVMGKHLGHVYLAESPEAAVERYLKQYPHITEERNSLYVIGLSSTMDDNASLYSSNQFEVLPPKEYELKKIF